jgi:rubredoxin
MAAPVPPSAHSPSWECRECLWLLTPGQWDQLLRHSARCPDCGRGTGAFRPLSNRWQVSERPDRDTR